MSEVFDVDDPQVQRQLIEQRPGGPEVLPRMMPYSDDPAAPQYEGTGAVPLGAYADQLVQPRDYERVIEYCHEHKIFPIYHQYDSWCPPGERWNQNGLPYCWAWGVTAALMDCRAREGKPTKLLSPVSLGFTVNWQSRGNYLMSAMAGIRNRGVCEQTYTPNIHSRSYRQYRDGWVENAKLYRLAEYWDCDNRSDSRMDQHLLTVLAASCSAYVAHGWWGHALEIVSLELERGKFVYVHRNSHNETDVIRLTGGRGCPDEAYGIRATVLTEEIGE